MTLYHPSSQETNTIIKRIFASLSNPSGGYKIKCPDEIITITKLGSRLWGTYTYQSDYDCLVIHNNPSKTVRHLGATIAAKEIDVRLESVDSFVEQMKSGGSVRCWLAFLLLMAETIHHNSSKETPPSNSDHSDNQDDDENETDEEDSSLPSTYRHTSVLFPQVPSESEKVKHFIRHVISSVGALHPKTILSKVSETLIEDQQRVTKLIEQDTKSSIDKIQKIIKHSLRLVFSVELIVKAMIVRKTDQSENDQNDKSAKKSKAKAKSTKASSSPQVMWNAFSPTLNLEKDVFLIEEEKFGKLAKTDPLFAQCLLEGASSFSIDLECVAGCYRNMLGFLPQEILMNTHA